MAACLHSLMAFLSAREDVFCVGELSSAVAAELESLAAAKTRRKVGYPKIFKETKYSKMLFNRLPKTVSALSCLIEVLIWPLDAT